MSEQAHPRERAHPTPQTYVKVATALAALTATELAVFYIHALRPAILPIFLVLLGTKFALMTMFFMHLRSDSRLFSGLFVGGMMLAAAIMIAFLALFQVLVRRPAVASALPTGPVPQVRVAQTTTAPDPQAGAQVFLRVGCAACHTLEGLSGAQGVIGPKLNGVATRAATRKPPLTAEEYIRESLENPTAYVVEGYPPVMLSLRGTMTDAEFNSLVAYLLTLR
ncbi:MAG: c-type cytochrome [Chloroflexi bacterium]|nr:c-type cytochrome [Chloroflexota bacterium]